MIKFIRKIRQKILTQNKFSKYLLYAVGEITLVVIGILIAVQKVYRIKISVRQTQRYS